MRFQEFKTVLTESSLAFGEIRKDYGNYVVGLADKIRGGKELMVDPAHHSKYGETVVVEPQEAERLVKTFFGDTLPDDHANMNVTGDRNLVVPPDEGAAKNIRLKLKGSNQTIGTGALFKSPDLKGGKGFNTGDVAEGVLGAAVAAKFIKRGGLITEKDIANVIKGFSSIEEVVNQKTGKKTSNKRGSMAAKAGEDQVTFTLVLNKTSFDALYESAAKDKYAPEMKGLFLSGVKYANEDDDVRNAISQVVDDSNSNEVVVNSDGVADQTGTKADLFLNIDGTVINLLSLKAGDVKQFGQASGYSYDKLEEFFQTTFGIQLHNDYLKRMEGGGARENFEIIKEMYRDITQQIQSEIAGNTNQEVTFLQRLYNGIYYHATRNDPNVSMVIMKATPNSPGFAKLTFGEELREAMEQFDLQIKMQENPPKIQIYGVPVGSEAKKLAGSDMLLQIRSNLKGDTAEGYVRNIVEMGGLLKKIAKVEQIIDAEPEEPAVPGSGDGTQVTPPKQ